MIFFCFFVWSSNIIMLQLVIDLVSSLRSFLNLWCVRISHIDFYFLSLEILFTLSKSIYFSLYLLLGQYMGWHISLSSTFIELYKGPHFCLSSTSDRLAQGSTCVLYNYVCNIMIEKNNISGNNKTSMKIFQLTQQSPFFKWWDHQDNLKFLTWQICWEWKHEKCWFLSLGNQGYKLGNHLGYIWWILSKFGKISKCVIRSVQT